MKTKRQEDRGRQNVGAVPRNADSLWGRRGGDDVRPSLPAPKVRGRGWGGCSFLRRRIDDRAGGEVGVAAVLEGRAVVVHGAA